jgi:uroporphyrinogen-III synthase
MSEHPDVVLLRSGEEAPDPYVSAFERAGLHAVCEPVLAFVFPNQERLQARLERRDRYEALIATSPRVGTALKRLFADRKDLARAWQGTTAYAVGPKTAARLQTVGADPKGADAGGAAALAHQIVEDAPDEDLLFLCGNRRRDTLPDRLRAEGVAFEEIVVYETRTRQDLTLPPSRPTSGPTWIAFFSPSGLEAVEQAASVNLREYRVAAIGPTTGGALEDAGYAVEAVAAEPSPDGLVSAIQAAETDA